MRMVGMALLLSLGLGFGPVQAAEPVLPQLIWQPETEHPLVEGEDPAAPHPAVLLELDVGPDGQVLFARVVESQGPEIDEAAERAAMDLRFTPAQDAEGRVTSARIRYGLKFGPAIGTPPPEPEPAADPSAADSDGPGGEIVVESRRTSPEVTERVLEAKDIQVLPGTGGDAVRVVQNLPGVSRPPVNIGQLIIRGTAPEDSAALLDGGPIPLVFHFSGLTTVVNTDSLSEVAFLPGNQGVRYGRILGGLVDLRFTRDLPEDSRSYVSVDVFQATAFTEQPIGERTALTLSARRSYIDAVLNPILNGGPTSIQAPRYYDLSARVLHLPDKGGSIDALVLVSDDRFRFFDEDGVEDLGLSTTFQKLRFRWLQPAAGAWTHETTLVVGPERQSFTFEGDGEAYEAPLMASARQELRSDSTGLFDARLGLDLEAGLDRFLYDVPGFGDPEEAEVWVLAPAPYAELTWRPGALRLTPGVRTDIRWLDTGDTLLSVDPRLGGRFILSDNTALIGGVGIHSQPPENRQVIAAGEVGDTLKPAWALHKSLGIEHQFTGALRGGLTGFHNSQHDLVVGREDRFAFFSGPPDFEALDTGPYANAGSGLVYGVESLLELQADSTVGLLSATWSRSLRTDRDGDEGLFRYDQPWVINALVSQELPRNWRLGSRVRFSSGNPYTPIENRIYDVGTRSFIPLFGETDSARLPSFFSLDLRVDKTFNFERWSLTTYLDLQNATNAQNLEVINWTYDYSEEEPVAGLPLVPSFGLRGEF